MLSQFIGNLDVVAGGLLDSAPLRRPTAARQAVAESVARLKLQSASMEIACKSYRPSRAAAHGRA